MLLIILFALSTKLPPLLFPVQSLVTIGVSGFKIIAHQLFGLHSACKLATNELMMVSRPYPVRNHLFTNVYASVGHVDYHFPNNVTYLQVWARTNCITTGPFQCDTGDCGSNIQCDRSRSDTSPVSMAEVWPNPIGVEKYDVTIFNGFNVPVKITPSVITPTKILGNLPCSPLGGCGYTLTNISTCPEELRFLPHGIIKGCFHPCTVYKTPEYCCTGEYANPQKCSSTPNSATYRAIFKEACPTTRTSPFDTPMGTCVGVHPLNVFYIITFC